MNDVYFFDNKQNNFDFIRFLAAIAVVVSHSYDLANKGHLEPLRQLTTYSFGYFGVRAFFIISGYLIIKSLLSSSSSSVYFFKRALRIFPGLIVVVLFCIFILGPFATALPTTEYFQRPETYTYFSNILLYHAQSSLPGVFETINKSVYVNGSLWTLVYEFTFYIGLFCALKVGILSKRLTVLIFLLLLIISDICLQDQSIVNNYYPSVNMAIGPFIEFSIFFLSGIIFHLYREKIIITKLYGCLVSAILILLIVFLPPSLSRIINYILLPYALFFFSFMKGAMNDFGKYGDYSYGFYIYSFPIQNLIFHYFPNAPTWYFFALSIICVSPFAFLSWTFVEAPMIRLKRFVGTKPLISH